MKDYVESLGIIAPKAVYRNLTPARLVEAALRRGEGTLSETGALVVTTGKYTGRSPNDRFVVDVPCVHDEIAWGKVNVPIEKEKADRIYNRLVSYLQGREIFIFDGYAGADPEYSLPVRVVNELASQNLFIHQLLVRPTEEQLSSFVPGFTVIAAPGFKCIPEVDGVNSEAAIIIDFEEKRVIICGSQYAGEIKKSIFSVMNFLMPKEDVLPMHCSANMDPETGDTAVFFGLSGT
ncbi:MAG: phosphoenolpyruvate carboxykinase (ATP), partial [Clostridia bacterium]|nr:phosphoenolpyruvate carboxykinase (ATP) [Clostridia bacterium]